MIRPESLITHGVRRNIVPLDSVPAHGRSSSGGRRQFETPVPTTLDPPKVFVPVQVEPKPGEVQMIPALPSTDQ
jgi:hypothetical protein